MKFIDLYNYNNGRLDLLSEDTVNDIRNRVRTPRKNRSKPVISNLIDVNKSWTVTFKSNAITSKIVDHYIQTIRPVNPPTGIPTLGKVRTAFDGDVVITCNCPDQRWKGYKYFGKRGGYGLKLKGRPFDIAPLIKNPEKDRSMCKHLFNTTGTLKFNIPSILKLYNDKFIKNK